MDKGTRVVVRQGKDAGATGIVFWVGKSKHGDGMRVGLKTDAGETVWADEAWVEVAGAEAPAAAGGGQAAAFYFYGDFPSDWIEGASDGHGFSVQFVEPPDPQRLEAIAELYESMLSTGMARPSREPWGWSGRFAHFEVGERGDVGPGVLGPVKACLRRIHAVAPIRDVVYANARESAQATDASRPPDPGPAGWQYLGVFGRAVDPGLPPLAPIPAFERARLACASRAWAQKTLAKIEAEIDRSAGKKGIRLERFDGQGPEARAWTRQQLALFSNPRITRQEKMDEQGLVPGDHLIDGTWDLPLAWVVARPGRAYATVACLHAGARREVALPEGMRGLCCVDAHPDGQRLLIGGQDRIVEVALDSGEVAERGFPALGERLVDVRYLADDQWAALTRERLHLQRRTDRGDAPLDRVEVSHLGRLQAVLAGRVVAAYGDHGQPQLYGLAHGRLKKLGSTRAEVDHLAEHDGAILAGVLDAPGRWYRLVGLREAVEQLERSKPRVKKAQRPIIQLRTHTEVPEALRSSSLSRSPVEQELAWKERFGARFSSAIDGWGDGLNLLQTAEAPGGVLATVFDANRIGLSRREGHFEELHRLKPGQEIHQLTFEPSGRWLFACCDHRSIVRLDLDEPKKKQRSEVVLDDPSMPCEICAIRGSRLLGFYYAGVCLLERAADAWAVQAARKVPRANRAAFCAPLEAVFTFDTLMGGVTAWAVRGKKLEQVWKTTHAYVRATVVGERVFMHPDWVDQLPFVELEDLAAALGV